MELFRYFQTVTVQPGDRDAYAVGQAQTYLTVDMAAATRDKLVVLPSQNAVSGQVVAVYATTTNGFHCTVTQPDGTELVSLGETGVVLATLAPGGTHWVPMSLPVQQRYKALQNGVAAPLLKVDIAQTINEASLLPDYTWSGEVHVSLEDRDNATTDTQIRAGWLQAALAYRSTGAVWNTIAQLVIGGTSAATAGVLNAVFSWATAGTVATLSVTPNATVITPSRMSALYLVTYSTHPAALTLL
jgi:hypothetical protein